MSINTYNKVLIESINHKLKIPTKEQYYKNTYYYNNRMKRINNKLIKKIMKEYGSYVYYNGVYSPPPWLVS